MNFLNVENPFWQAVNKVLQCIQASALWLLFSIPLVTAGPAAAALYTTVYRVIRKDEGYVWQTFKDAFRENFKKCTLLGIMALFFLLLLLADLWIFRRLALYGNVLGNLYWIMLVIFCLAVTWMTYVFCYAARFEGTVKDILRTGFLLFVLHPLKAGMVFLFLAGGLFLVIEWPVFLLVLPAAVLWIGSMVMEDVFHRHMREEDLKREKEEMSL